MSITVRSALSAPVWLSRKALGHPVKAGAAVMGLDMATKAASHLLTPNSAYCLPGVRACLQLQDNANGTFGRAFHPTTASYLTFGIALTGLAAIFTKVKSQVAKVGLALVMSGSLSNFLERSVRGGVTDFIQIGSWYDFNVADAAAVTGGLLCAFSIGKAAYNYIAQRFGSH